MRIKTLAAAVGLAALLSLLCAGNAPAIPAVRFGSTGPEEVWFNCTAGWEFDIVAPGGVWVTHLLLSGSVPSGTVAPFDSNDLFRLVDTPDLFLAPAAGHRTGRLLMFGPYTAHASLVFESIKQRRLTMKRPFLLRMLFVVFFCLTSSSVWSTVIYRYTGQHFDEFSNASGGPYDDTMNVTATLEFDSMLPPDLPRTWMVPSGFSISDGLNTIDDTNFTARNVTIGTDSSGMIDDWFVFAYVSTASNFWYIETINSSVIPDLVWDYGGSGYPELDTASISDDPGSWSVVPEPTTFALVGLGLAALGRTRRRMRDLTGRHPKLGPDRRSS